MACAGLAARKTSLKHSDTPTFDDHQCPFFTWPPFSGQRCVSRCTLKYHIWLVVWNMFYFPINIGNFIIPIDELIFFRGVALAHQPDIEIHPHGWLDRRTRSMAAEDPSRERQCGLVLDPNHPQNMLRIWGWSTGHSNIAR